MNIGMLWYDESPLALKERIEKAAGYYAEKYGHKPNLCVVHPSMLEAEELRVNGVLVRRGPGIRPGHFWIGVDDEPAETPRPARAARKPSPAKSAKSGKPRSAAQTKPARKPPSAAPKKKTARKRAGRS
jgi:hypothetical protein